ncbi:energy-coupling factor transport system permease protein [Ruminococcaceae bacterium P7]|nr:energy-coupling factor transport system permease protein [Ruminococcaceae bacterium P7]
MRGGLQAIHPAVSLLYFTAVIVFAMFLMNPVCLTLSLLCSAATAVVLNGRKTVLFALKVILPLALLAIVINPFVNHRGVTVLGYLPWNNPLTLESILFGVASAVMLSSTVLWFSSFHTVMTSDKLVFLFGKTLPALGLMLSMSLRFVPKFNEELREVRNAQRLLFPEKSGLIPRIKSAVRVLSVMISRALEDSLETADSMKARGYGLKGRTAYSRYRMTGQDWFLLSVTIVLTAAIAGFCFCKTARFRYYPSVTQLKSAADTFIFYGTYAVLLLIPLILTVGEGIRWRKYESNI